MRYRLQITGGARRDIDRLVNFQAQRDPEIAERAYTAITDAFDLLREFPFSCRKMTDDNPFLRELVIEFGTSGYVALFLIQAERMVMVIAIRHQLEEDYQ